MREAYSRNAIGRISLGNSTYKSLSLLSYKVKARSVFKIARFILRVLLFAFLTLKFLIARRATLVVVSRERNDLENVPRLSSFLASREYRLCQ